MTSDLRFIPVSEPLLDGRELEYVSDCVRSGWVSSLGKYITEFELRFSNFCGTQHAVAVSNGTTALHLALAALRIGPGDEVIVPSLTFIATANAVRYTGATPIFADCDPLTWNIAPEEIERLVSPRTRAVIPVHLYGHPADMPAILAAAQKYDLAVIEDAAEAHGARCGGRRVGSFGVVNTFSFYGNKIITTGEGGMLTTDDLVLSERLRYLRDHAMSPDRRYYHTEVGFNYRMTNLQAALGVAQMERIEEFIRRKQAIAARYDELLAGLPGVELPPRAVWAEPVFWMYSIVLSEKFAVGREEVMASLRRQGIDSRPFFYPIHTLPPYAQGQASLPVAERLGARGINLPSAVSLREEDQQRIAAALRHIASPAVRK